LPPINFVKRIILPPNTKHDAAINTTNIQYAFVSKLADEFNKSIMSQENLQEAAFWGIAKIASISLNSKKLCQI